MSANQKPWTIIFGVVLLLVIVGYKLNQVFDQMGAEEEHESEDYYNSPSHVASPVKPAPKPSTTSSSDSDVVVITQFLIQ